MAKDKNTALANFLYEVGMLAHTPRAGFQFLGTGHHSVAEHTNRMVYCGYVLSKMNGKVDTDKIVKMCLFHDLSEARTSDTNYVHQKYATRDESRAISDLAKTLPFGAEIESLVGEFTEGKTPEAILAKDADQIDHILALKEQVEIGNTRAKSWFPPFLGRLKTKEAKELAQVIMQTDSDAWWYTDKDGNWWVDRDKKG
jgi:putative hydrolase of HD superfamily